MKTKNKTSKLKFSRHRISASLFTIAVILLSGCGRSKLETGIWERLVSESYYLDTNKMLFNYPPALVFETRKSDKYMFIDHDFRSSNPYVCSGKGTAFEVEGDKFTITFSVSVKGVIPYSDMKKEGSIKLAGRFSSQPQFTVRELVLVVNEKSNLYFTRDQKIIQKNEGHVKGLAMFENLKKFRKQVGDAVKLSSVDGENYNLKRELYANIKDDSRDEFYGVELLRPTNEEIVALSIRSPNQIRAELSLLRFRSHSLVVPANVEYRPVSITEEERKSVVSKIENVSSASARSKKSQGRKESDYSFVENRLKATVGAVVELRRVRNGAYYGFPTDEDVSTFDGTCMTKYGSKNVVIAVKEQGDTYVVVKVNIK